MKIKTKTKTKTKKLAKIILTQKDIASLFDELSSIDLYNKIDCSTLLKLYIKLDVFLAINE